MNEYKMGEAQRGVIKGKGWSAEFAISRALGNTHVWCKVVSEDRGLVETVLRSLHNMLAGGKTITERSDGLEITQEKDFETKVQRWQGYTRFSFCGCYDEPKEVVKLPPPLGNAASIGLGEVP